MVGMGMHRTDRLILRTRKGIQIRQLHNCNKTPRGAVKLQAMAHTNLGELIAWPTENGVSPLPPLKSASNVNIMIGTGYLIRSIYLSKYGDDNIFLWMLSKGCYTREKNKHMRAAKEASITPNRDTTRGKNLTGKLLLQFKRLTKNGNIFASIHTPHSLNQGQGSVKKCHFLFIFGL